MNRNHECAGLGLSTINSLVKLNGGTMSIESVVDMLTTVTVRFPF
jgi:signal transduction histidine kinase